LPSREWWLNKSHAARSGTRFCVVAVLGVVMVARNVPLIRSYH
jgi:hypothetical protein